MNHIFAPQRLTVSSHDSILPPMYHKPTPTIAWTGTIQLLRLPHFGTNQASTIGDHRSLREYGHVDSENTANWEYDRCGFMMNGNVPNVSPNGIPCSLSGVSARRRAIDYFGLTDLKNMSVGIRTRDDSYSHSNTSKANAFRSLGLFKPSSLPSL